MFNKAPAFNKTPSYPDLLAAQKAWLAVFNDPSAAQGAKDAAKEAYKAVFMKCRLEANIAGCNAQRWRSLGK